MEVTNYVNNNASDPRNIKDYPLVIYFLKKSKFLLIEENIDACIEGLAVAYKTYDPSKGVFSSYAMKCMYCVMCRKLRDENLQRLIPKDKIIHVDFTYCIDSNVKSINTADGSRTRRNKSTDLDINMLTIEDVDNSLIVQEALSILKDRERDIILKRYMEDKSLESIGAELNLSRQRVAQIEKIALYKMRVFLND